MRILNYSIEVLLRRARLEFSNFINGAAPGTPPAGEVRLYSKTDKKLYYKDDTGVETQIGAGGASPLTTKGDIHGFSTTDARIPVGADGQVLVADSTKALGVKWANLLQTNKDTTLSEVVNTTAETTIYSFSVPANTLGTSGWIRLSIFGTILNNSGGTYNITAKLKFGATTIAQQTVGNAADSTNIYGYKLDAYIAANGATNAQKGGFVIAGRALNNGFLMGAHGTAAEDSTTAKTLSITIALGIAHPQFSFKKESALLEIL
jgi:hypothetical protein